MSTQLRRIDKWAPSQNPYWFDLRSVHPRGSGAWSVDAIWAGRKNGRTVITLGTYGFFDPTRDTVGSRAEVIDMIENSDTRYGGNWQYRWDGEHFQSSPRLASLTLEQAIIMRDALVAVHNEPMEWFNRNDDRWLGPYYKTEVE